MWRGRRLVRVFDFDTSTGIPCNRQIYADMHAEARRAGGKVPTKPNAAQGRKARLAL